MSGSLVLKQGSLPLILGLLTNSYFLYGNLGAFTSGVVPYVAARKNSSPDEVVKCVHWFIDRDKTTHGSSAILSVPLFGYAAYYASDATISRLLIIATLSTAFGIPYTHLFIRPLNSAFARMASASPQTLQGKEQETHELLRKWQIQAFVRVMLGAISWGAAVLALQAS